MSKIELDDTQVMLLSRQINVVRQEQEAFNLLIVSFLSLAGINNENLEDISYDEKNKCILYSVQGTYKKDEKIEGQQ